MLLLGGAASLCGAGTRTLSAPDGRTIEAEVLGFEGTDKVIIKRADSGQTFTLPITTFSEADQRALRVEAAEAAKKPPPLRSGDLGLELSRIRLDSRKTKTDVPLTNGDVIKDGFVVTEEDWGYSLTLKNNTLRPVEGLRADYILYTRIDEIKNTGRKPATRAKSFTTRFDPLPPGGRVAAKTEGVITRKTDLRGGLRWRGTGDDDTRDTLVGIWLRVYRGDELVLEASSPDGLASTEKWIAPQSLSGR